MRVLKETMEKRVDRFIELRKCDTPIQEIAKDLGVDVTCIYRTISYKAAEKMQVPRENLLFSPHRPHIWDKNIHYVEQEGPASINGKVVKKISGTNVKKEETPEEKIKLANSVIDMENEEISKIQSEVTLLEILLSEKEENLKCILEEMHEMQSECNTITEQINAKNSEIEEHTKYIDKRKKEVEELQKQITLHFTIETESVNQTCEFVDSANVDESKITKIISKLIWGKDKTAYSEEFFQKVDDLKVTDVKTIAFILVADEDKRKANKGKYVIWHFAKSNFLSDILKIAGLNVEIDEQ